MKCRATYVLATREGEYAGEGTIETSAFASPSEVTAWVIRQLQETGHLLQGMQLRIRTEIVKEEERIVPVFSCHAWPLMVLMALTEDERVSAAGLIISLILGVVCALIWALCRHGESAEERFADWIRDHRERGLLHESGDVKFEREEEMGE